MTNDEKTVAEVLPEPENGTVLVVGDTGGEWRVIWRDDVGAKRWGGNETERWFSHRDSDPMELYQHVKYAEAVYRLGDPVAVFRS